MTVPDYTRILREQQRTLEMLHAELGVLTKAVRSIGSRDKLRADWPHLKELREAAKRGVRHGSREMVPAEKVWIVALEAAGLDPQGVTLYGAVMTARSIKGYTVVKPDGAADDGWVSLPPDFAERWWPFEHFFGGAA